MTSGEKKGGKNETLITQASKSIRKGSSHAFKANHFLSLDLNPFKMTKRKERLKCSDK